jgi:type II secretory pathway pseudopilin PulG
MIDRLSLQPKREDAQGLVELIVALTILAVGIGSLLTLLTSSALSLQRSDQKGTALVLAEKQLELYRGMSYKDIRLDQHSLDTLSGVDPTGIYMAASSVPNSSIPSGTGQLTDTAPGNVTTPCDDSNPPPECLPVQIVSGPDHRSYRIDTYIHSGPPTSGGDDVATVYVVVRNGATPSQILARTASTFSSINIANINGKAIVKLSFSAPKSDVTNAPISASQISATLSNGSGETGLLSFYVLPTPLTPSAPCTGASWLPLGAVTVTNDGTYHPAGGYTPTTTGTYYWYATYSGDSANKKASSICGASMARMTVQASKWSPTLGMSTSASTGIINTAIPASSLTASIAGSSGTTTSAITYMVYGPSASAPATCTTTVGGLWKQVGTITPNGDGSYNPNTGFTPTAVGTYWYYGSYAADSTNNAASSLCYSSSMAKTVVTTPPDTFGISAIGASQTVGSAITIANITAQLYSGGTDTSYTGVKTLVFSGPSTSPKGNAPSYPASVTFTNGIATNVSFTDFTAETTTLTATQGLITGTSNSFTVSGGSASAFKIDTVPTQTVNAAFGVTVRAVDAYGNAATYSGPHTISWSGPANAPNGTPPFLTASTATSLTFSNVAGQGVAVATGLTVYKAASTTLTATEGTKNGTSSAFTVNAAAASAMAFVNCTQPSAANTTCAGSPLSTGNNGTLQANVSLIDAYGNTATAASALSINLSSSSTADYTVAPSPVSIASGGTQSNQLTVTPKQNNPGLTTITAHATSGGFADISIKVQK